MSYRWILAIAFLSIAGCRPLTQAADLPPTRPNPPSIPSPTQPPPTPPAAASPAQPATPAVVDPEVRTASAITAPPSGAMSITTPPAADERSAALDREKRAREAPISAKFTGMSVARVGTEEITLAELRYAIQEIKREQGGDDSKLSKQERVRRDYKLGEMLLKHMIEQTLVVQEAKRRMGTKDKKKWDQFVKIIDKQFDEQKLPHLLKRNDAVDENDLRLKLEQKGQSLDEIRKNFRNDVITQQFMYSTVVSTIRPELPALEAYYHAHLHEFDAPAQVSFREIVLKFEDEAQKVSAKRKAETLLARLRRGEEFAKLAKSESEGATADKGGLWEKVVPGGFAEEVNAAVDRLPIRQISPIIEGPNTLRIVRVESRRKAGPLSFEEAQKEVTKNLSQQLTSAAIDKLLAKLRSKTIITNKFEENEDDPDVQKASAKAEAPRR